MSLVITDFKNGFIFTALATSGTAGPFTILGGKYNFMCIDTGTINATLQMLGPDGTTYIPVVATLTATTFATYDLPAGTIEVVSGSGATSLSASLIPIPYRPAV